MVCGIWASEVQFVGHFGPQNKYELRSLVIVSQIIHGFRISFGLHIYLS